MKRAEAVVRSLGAFGLLFAVRPALAAGPLPPTTAQLEYTRPPGCPSERDLRYEVSRRLGQDPFVEEGLFRVVAEITRQKNTLAGSLEIYDGDGQTIVHKHTSYPAWDCATLVSGMAIAISVRLDELVERAWSRVQRARRWRNRWAAVRALLCRPALHLGVTFLGGGALGAALALALQPTPHPAPVVFVQPTLTEPVVAINLASASPPMSAVAALPVPLASSSVSSARSGQHRKSSAEQRAFDIAHQAFLRGSFKEALAALKSQERDYPAGELAAERETLRAQIARLGDTSAR